MSTSARRNNRRLTISEWLAATDTDPKELAERAGLHISTVYEVVRGRRWPSYVTIQRIRRATDGAVVLWDVEHFIANQRVASPSRLFKVRLQPGAF